MSAGSVLKDELTELLPEDSWFRDYMECWPHEEPPRSYLLFSAMCMLGAALGRRVWIDMGVHKTYPLMNLLLIGPSGIGKSTALRNIALKNLVSPLPDDLRPQVITGKSTKEALHEDLYAQPHSIILASELSNFFSKEKYQEGMLPYITDLLDLEPSSIRTKGGGPAKVIREPACCICGGSTKEWLQDQLPSNAGEGGFLPRFFIVKEDHKAQRVPDPRKLLTKAKAWELEKKREGVFGYFRALCRNYSGPIDFADYSASDEYAVWYQTFMPETGSLAPFAARAGAHVLRLALLVAISCEQADIRDVDVRSAIALHGYSLGRLQEVIVPMTAQGKMISKLMDVLSRETMSEASIARAMRNYCGAQDVRRMLEGLLMSKEVALVDGNYRRTTR